MTLGRSLKNAVMWHIPQPENNTMYNETDPLVLYLTLYQFKMDPNAAVVLEWLYKAKQYHKASNLMLAFQIDPDYCACKPTRLYCC